MEKHFRKNAGVVVFNAQKKVLMCRRVQPKTDGWQFPQGGIEPGETPLQAAQRELFEETSITSVVAVKTIDYALRYEFPENVKQKFRSQGILSDGQDQYWSLFYFTGKDSEINLHTDEPEFDEYEWKNIEEAPDLVWVVKKDVYFKMVKEFKPIIDCFDANATRLTAQTRRV